MSRTIYTNYSKFTNINGASDVLAKLRTFALANGWAEEYYHTNVEWASDGDGTYSYGHAGDNDVLGLTSTGYGNMNLVVRFKAYNYDGSSDRIDMYMIDPNNATINYATATEPITQNDINYSTQYFNSMPNSSFPEMCIIGNASVIYLHMRYNTIFCPSFGFGVPELIPAEQAEDEFNWVWVQGTTLQEDWYDVADKADCNNYFTPFECNARNYYMDGAYTLVQTAGPQIAINFNEVFRDWWSQRHDLIATNAFSGFRTLVSVPWFRKNSSTNVWRCVGHMPCYYVVWGGLTWGEIITRGSEQYLVFPTLFTTGDYGVAWRIV